MKAFRVVLAAIFLTTLTYTIVVGGNHGLNFIPIFFGDILAMNWPGQFNVDFTFHIFLAALWMAWRNNFSFSGYLLAALAFVGGIHVLVGYLFYTSYQVSDIKELLVGKAR